jgi:hypothetical protein
VWHSSHIVQIYQIIILNTLNIQSLSFLFLKENNLYQKTELRASKCAFTQGIQTYQVIITQSNLYCQLSLPQDGVGRMVPSTDRAFVLALQAGRTQHMQITEVQWRGQEGTWRPPCLFRSGRNSPEQSTVLLCVVCVFREELPTHFMAISGQAHLCRQPMISLKSYDIFQLHYWTTTMLYPSS